MPSEDLERIIDNQSYFLKIKDGAKRLVGHDLFRAGTYGGASYGTFECMSYVNALISYHDNICLASNNQLLYSLSALFGVAAVFSGAAAFRRVVYWLDSRKEKEHEKIQPELLWRGEDDGDEFF